MPSAAVNAGGTGLAAFWQKPATFSGKSSIRVAKIIGGRVPRTEGTGARSRGPWRSRFSSFPALTFPRPGAVYRARLFARKNPPGGVAPCTPTEADTCAGLTGLQNPGRGTVRLSGWAWHPWVRRPRRPLLFIDLPRPLPGLDHKCFARPESPVFARGSRRLRARNGASGSTGVALKGSRDPSELVNPEDPHRRGRGPSFRDMEVRRRVGTNFAPADWSSATRNTPRNTRLRYRLSRLRREGDAQAEDGAFALRTWSRASAGGFVGYSGSAEYQIGRSSTALVARGGRRATLLVPSAPATGGPASLRGLFFFCPQAPQILQATASWSSGLRQVTFPDRPLLFRDERTRAADRFRPPISNQLDMEIEGFVEQEDVFDARSSR